jgi:hypothetical protein
MFTENYEEDIGECCFCGEECNACSQSCGTCSRSLSGYAIGMNPLPEHLTHVFSLKEENKKKCICGESSIFQYNTNFCCQCWTDLFQFSCGLKRLPQRLDHLADEYKNKVCIFYCSDEYRERQLFYEEEFRKVIFENMDKFPKPCVLNPYTCDLDDLIKWADAEKIYHGPPKLSI